MAHDFSDTPEEQKETSGVVDRPEVQIGRALQEARHQRKITQQQLSVKTGIAQADISRIENANANPSLKTLQRLATGLDMSLVLSMVDNES